MKKLGIVILALLASGLANATVLKIATVAPEGSDWMKQMRAGASEIKDRTEGRVQIKFYGGGVMGTATKVLGKIRIGALQGGAFTPSALQGIYPEISLVSLPLTFDSEEEAAYVRKRLDPKMKAGLEEAGFVSFGFAAAGFAMIMSNEPVRGLNDMKGKRVWVPEGDTISYASMAALSLSPVTLPLTDVLTGLQTGLLDVVAMSPIGALVLQWHTKVKYITDLPLVYTIGFMVVDKRAYNKIDAADRAIADEVMTRIYAQFDKDNLVENKKAYEALLNSGIKRVSVNAAELDSIRTILGESNRSLAEQGEYSLALYDEMMQYVEEYRNGNATSAGQ